MTDQEQTSSQTETTNSENQTSSESPEQVSDTSTTESKETVDLAAEEGGEQTAETKEGEDTRTEEERAADEARAALFGAPAEGESYTIEGLPEGMEIDTEALEAITPVFRELNLSSAGASKLAAIYAEKVLPAVAERSHAAIEQQIVATRATWEDDARNAVKTNGAELKNKAGEALAFDGKDLNAVRSTAAKALDRLAPAGFREFLQETGLSVHPAMMAFAYQAGKLIAEDTELEVTETGRGKAATRTEKYYGR